jgi:hypothetical protein
VKRYPDPYANPARMRRNRIALVLGSVVLSSMILIMLKASYDRLSDARSALNAARSAETLLPSTKPRKPVATIDLKKKAYLTDLKSTAVKLSIDWNARIASVENSLSSDLSINAFRVDAQKGEIELKGEASSNSKVTSIIAAMQSTGLDARVGRLARQQNGASGGSSASAISSLEYSILIAWPQ